MNYDELKQIWAQKYDTVPQQLEKLKQILFQSMLKSLCMKDCLKENILQGIEEK